MRKIEGRNLYIVSEQEIELKYTSWKEPRSTCPACSAERSHPNDASVSWNLAAGVGFCHRCGAGFKIDNNPQSFSDRYVNNYAQKVKDSKNTPSDMAGHLLPLDTESLLYLGDRCISESTARAAGLCSRNIWKASTCLHWLAFPFYVDNKLVNVQYKMADIQQKNFFFEQGGEMVPWNIDCINDESAAGALYITEGMMDALALMECGCRCVVSVPNGANSSMSCFDRFAEKIRKRFDYIVFAGDTDTPGKKLCNSICEYFNDMDVCITEWRTATNEYKDANELLMMKGCDAVNNCLGVAESAACVHLSFLGEDEEGIDELYDKGIPKGNKIGLPGFDDIIRFQEGNLLLITGYPGSGKSTLVNYICMSLFRGYGWRTLFFSPEKMPQKYHEAELISIIMGTNFEKKEIPRDRYEWAKDVLRNNFLYIGEEISSIDDIIHLARRAARISKVKVLVIDPFIYLDMPAIPGASETQKIAIMLKQLMLATRELNMMVILVAHPRKPSQDGPAEPSLYEVAGSANFYNFCDAGIILERVKGTKCVVKVTCGKARREFNGALGECQLAFDSTCGRYIECDKVNDTNKYLTSHKSFNNKRWSFSSMDEKSLFEKETTGVKNDGDKKDAECNDNAPQNGTINFDDAPLEHIDPGEQND